TVPCSSRCLSSLVSDARSLVQPTLPLASASSRVRTLLQSFCRLWCCFTLRPVALTLLPRAGPVVLFSRNLLCCVLPYSQDLVPYPSQAFDP
ncbi:MAG: hypothetical protein ACK559_30875, partial [bacterium]